MNKEHAADNEEFEDLVARHFDGSLSAEEEARLRDVLRSTPEARELMAEYMRVEGRDGRTSLSGSIAPSRAIRSVP